MDLAKVDESPVRCFDSQAEARMISEIESAAKEGDSLGGIVEVLAYGLPVGLGSYVHWDRKLDGLLAQAIMSIQAVKGVEIGAGFGVVNQRGSEHRDELSRDGFLSNQSGGVLGGISSGQPITVGLALKPTSSIQVPGQSIDVNGDPADVITTGRHDPCVGLRAVPIAEAMLALVLIDHALRHRGQNADVTSPTPII